MIAKVKGKLLGLASNIPILGKSLKGMDAALKEAKGTEPKVTEGLTGHEAAADSGLGQLDQLEEVVKK